MKVMECCLCCHEAALLSERSQEVKNNMYN